MVPVFAGSTPPETVAILIPIFAMFFGVVIVIAAIMGGIKKQRLAHQERLTALEKGLPLPEEPRSEKKPTHSARRAWGLVMLGMGIALTIAIWTAAGAVGGVWGLIPLFIGIGLLMAAAADKKEYEAHLAEDRGTGKPPTPPPPAPPSYGSSGPHAE